MRAGRVLLGGLLLASLAAGFSWQACRPAPGPHRPAGPRPPNVILVVIDTLRGDLAFGPGGEAAEMPFLHGLAQKGVVFTDVTAPAPWTVPSLASVLTGVTPRDHGAVRMVALPRLPAGVPTWAHAFGRAGYQTAAYVGGPWALNGSDGLLRGFDAAVKDFGFDQGPRRLGGWRSSLRPDAPFFLLLHTFDAHEPYGEENNRFRAAPIRPTPGFAARAGNAPHDWTRAFFLSRADRRALEDAHGAAFYDAVVRYIGAGYESEPRPELAAELRAAYVGGVRWVDGLLGTLVGWLESEGLLQDTIVAVTSDHGEAFGEHGHLAHGRDLHEELVHVPLVLTGPGFQGGRVVREHVSLMDLMPTLAEAARVPPPPGTVGASLAPLLTAGGAPRPAFAYELVNYEVTRADVERHLRGVRTARFAVHLDWDVKKGTLVERAYDRVADRGERVDLAGGRGTLEGLVLDAETCAAVERLRAELQADGMDVPRPPCGK
jgi:choline-sulfatase